MRPIPRVIWRRHELEYQPFHLALERKYCTIWQELAARGITSPSPSFLSKARKRGDSKRSATSSGRGFHVNDKTPGSQREDKTAIRPVCHRRSTGLGRIRQDQQGLKNSNESEPKLRRDDTLSSKTTEAEARRRSVGNFTACVYDATCLFAYMLASLVSLAHRWRRWRAGTPHTPAPSHQDKAFSTSCCPVGPALMKCRQFWGLARHACRPCPSLPPLCSSLSVGIRQIQEITAEFMIRWKIIMANDPLRFGQAALIRPPVSNCRSLLTFGVLTLRTCLRSIAAIALQNKFTGDEAAAMTSPRVTTSLQVYHTVRLLDSGSDSR